MDRRRFLANTAAVAVAAAAAAPVAAQAGGPVIRVIYPFGAGGSGDALARLMAEKIGAASGQSAIVENRTGADGRLAILYVKNAAPDGNTLLITTGPTMWLYPMTHPALGYEPLADFAPISQLARYDFCIAVANATGLTSMAALAAWLKADPDQAVYGVPGKGTIPHFTGVALARLLGIEMRVVAYRGGAPSMIDLVGGHIPIVIGTLSDALLQHRAGTIRILATTGTHRSSFLPEVPTLQESGFNLSGDAWYGLWAPAKTPAARIAAINAAVTAGLADVGIAQRLAAFGLVPNGGTPEALHAAMTADAAAWTNIVKATGFSME